MHPFFLAHAPTQKKKTHQTSDNGRFADGFCASHDPFLTQKGQETAKGLLTEQIVRNSWRHGAYTFFPPTCEENLAAAVAVAMTM
jgi:hypothetical protein